eukprot:623962_1
MHQTMHPRNRTNKQCWYYCKQSGCKNHQCRFAHKIPEESSLGQIHRIIEQVEHNQKHLSKQLRQIQSQNNGYALVMKRLDDIQTQNNNRFLSLNQSIQSINTQCKAIQSEIQMQKRAMTKQQTALSRSINKKHRKWSEKYDSDLSTKDAEKDVEDAPNERIDIVRHCGTILSPKSAQASETDPTHSDDECTNDNARANPALNPRTKLIPGAPSEMNTMATNGYRPSYQSGIYGTYLTSITPTSTPTVERCDTEYDTDNGTSSTSGSNVEEKEEEHDTASPIEVESIRNTMWYAANTNDGNVLVNDTMETDCVLPEANDDTPIPPTSITTATSKASKREHKNCPHQLKEEGNKLFKMKQYKNALAAYRAAHQLDPTEPIYVSNESAALYHMEEWDQFIACFDRLLDMKPDKPLVEKGIKRMHVIYKKTRGKYDGNDTCGQLYPKEMKYHQEVVNKYKRQYCKG